MNEGMKELGDFFSKTIHLKLSYEQKVDFSKFLSYIKGSVKSFFCG